MDSIVSYFILLYLTLFLFILRNSVFSFADVYSAYVRIVLVFLLMRQGKKYSAQMFSVPSTCTCTSLGDNSSFARVARILP